MSDNVDNNIIDVKKAAQFYNKSEFSIIKEMDLTRADYDKRHVYLLKFDDGEELALKYAAMILQVLNEFLDGRNSVKNI